MIPRWQYPDPYVIQEIPVSWKRLNFAEPAVLRGIVTAVLALGAALGFSASTEINGAAEAIIPIAAVLIPLLQSVWTRRAVFSPKSYAAGKHAAPEA